ncbi:MAG: hypothetical protein HY904_13200 [Deltaproteobacteria bacterium]|nr:hypothetical protein [Deltaproteobacteria bacterium]
MFPVIASIAVWTLAPAQVEREVVVLAMQCDQSDEEPCALAPEVVRHMLAAIPGLVVVSLAPDDERGVCSEAECGGAVLTELGVLEGVVGRVVGRGAGRRMELTRLVAGGEPMVTAQRIGARRAGWVQPLGQMVEELFAPGCAPCREALAARENSARAALRQYDAQRLWVNRDGYSVTAQTDRREVPGSRFYHLVERPDLALEYSRREEAANRERFRWRVAAWIAGSVLAGVLAMGPVGLVVHAGGLVLAMALTPAGVTGLVVGMVVSSMGLVTFSVSSGAGTLLLLVTAVCAGVSMAGPSRTGLEPVPMEERQALADAYNRALLVSLLSEEPAGAEPVSALEGD